MNMILNPLCFNIDIIQSVEIALAKILSELVYLAITLNKIKNFAIGLNNVCDVAIKNKYGLVGIGD